MTDKFLLSNPSLVRLIFLRHPLDTFRLHIRDAVDCGPANEKRELESLTIQFLGIFTDFISSSVNSE